MNHPTEDSSFGQCQRIDSEMRRQRSRAQPLPKSHVARTQSELQLSEDMAAAEWQDLCMFYRVVGGIREQQQQCSSRRHHGVPIHQSAQQEQQPIRDWTGKDVSSTVDTAARVTPFETYDSPQDNRTAVLPPYPKSLLVKSPRRSSDGGWSITGFDDDLQDNGGSPLALIEQDNDDEAIFVMDL